MPSLKDRFEEMLHLRWDEFIKLENSDTATIDDDILCSLIRLCCDTSNISSIKMAFDRVEGSLEIPINIKVPKFYIRYVNAKEIEGGANNTSSSKDVARIEDHKFDPASAKLRETLTELRKMPKQVIGLILKNKQLVEEGRNIKGVPQVKFVMMANLLLNVSEGNTKAVELVFEQIDGKIAKTITLLGGEDVYIDDFNLTIAPSHAIKDENGYYIAEDKVMSNNWLRGFSRSQKGLEMLAEGLDD